jgi:hypothetical protein
MLIQVTIFFFLEMFFFSNNNVQDDGVRDILEGLINQVNEDKTGKGLNILILWNNHLTTKSSLYISKIIVCIIEYDCNYFYNFNIFITLFFFFLLR